MTGIWLYYFYMVQSTQFPGLVNLLEGECGGGDHHVYFGRVHSVCTLIFTFFSMDVLKSILKFYHVHPILLLKLVFNNCFYNVTPQMPSMAHASS